MCMLYVKISQPYRFHTKYQKPVLHDAVNIYPLYGTHYILRYKDERKIPGKDSIQ